jgi:hypothetical protein
MTSTTTTPTPFIIECRATGQGAHTAPVWAENPHAEDFQWADYVTDFDHSKSGNHWRSRITLPNADAFVVVRDVSNSRKHRCYRRYGDGRVEDVYREGEPPACEMYP